MKHNSNSNGKKCKYCDSPAESLGLCNKHYLRYRRHGDPLYYSYKVEDELKEYEEYIDSVRDVLLLAEQIKNSPYHKKVLNHLRVMKQRGTIKDSPQKSNDYRIIRWQEGEKE